MSAVLDRVHTLAALEALAEDPGRVAAELDDQAAVSTLAELEARDARLAAALRAIDDFATRAMRIRLDHVLVGETALPAPTRKVFASTITSYAGDLGLLGERVRAVAVRSNPAGAAALADTVVAAARATLALRDAVRAPVLARIAALAAAALSDADACARDRRRDDAERTRWSAARRDLEVLAADPARILAAPFASRLAAWPDQLDEPAPEREPTRAELIELD